MTDQDMITRAKELIMKSPTCSLATVDADGFPQARAMMPVHVEDDLTTYYITHRQSAKCSQVAANPAASCLWVDVVEPMSDWRSVLVKGNATVTDDKALRDRFWMDQLRGFFPGGADDPNFVIIVIKPTELIFADAPVMGPQVVKL